MNQPVDYAQIKFSIELEHPHAHNYDQAAISAIVNRANDIIGRPHTGYNTPSAEQIDVFYSVYDFNDDAADETQMEWVARIAKDF